MSEESLTILQLMRVLLLLGLVLVAYIAAWGQTSRCPPGGGPGRWAASAEDLIASSDWRCADEQSRDLLVRSPDGIKFVHVRGDTWRVQIGKERLSPIEEKPFVGYPAELGWSGDSSRFYITQSDGSIGGFHTEVYSIESNRVVRLVPNLYKTVLAAFNAHNKCDYYDRGKKYSEEPNLAGLSWTNDSEGLVVVAEVRPDSSCDRDYFGGYLISISTGQILQTYSPEELLEKWGKVMGERLKRDLKNLSETERLKKP